jgi:phosphoribosylglycinamide formyltransferase
MADTLPESHAPPPTKITVLISGSGTNLQALIDASTAGLLLSTTIVRVISNKKNAYGLQRAEKATIPTAYHNLVAGKYHKAGEKDRTVIAKAREEYDADLAQLVLSDSPDLVVCAGFMHILAPTFLDPLEKAKVPVINLHPAKPGCYDGVAAIERAFNDFKDGRLENDTTGCMIHYVISEVDRGEPILVREIKCVEGETLESLEAKMHAEEHQIIVTGTGLAIARLWEERRKSGGA